MVAALGNSQRVFHNAEAGGTSKAINSKAPLSEKPAPRSLKESQAGMVKTAFGAENAKQTIMIIGKLVLDRLTHEEHLQYTSSYYLHPKDGLGAGISGPLHNQKAKHYACEFICDGPSFYLSGSVDGKSFESGRIHNAGEAIAAIEKFILNYDTLSDGDFSKPGKAHPGYGSLCGRRNLISEIGPTSASDELFQLKLEALRAQSMGIAEGMQTHSRKEIENGLDCLAVTLDFMAEQGKAKFYGKGESRFGILAKVPLDGSQVDAKIEYRADEGKMFATWFEKGTESTREITNKTLAYEIILLAMKLETARVRADPPL